MKKIPALFIREERGNPKDQTGYLPELNRACLWVFEPGVRATVKWDGTAVLVQDGMPWARFDAKRGKTPPPAPFSTTAAEAVDRLAPTQKQGDTFL